MTLRKRWPLCTQDLDTERPALPLLAEHGQDPPPLERCLEQLTLQSHQVTSPPFAPKTLVSPGACTVSQVLIVAPSLYITRFLSGATAPPPKYPAK